MSMWSVANWISLNYLILNILKCCYMIFTRKSYPTLPTTTLVVNNLALAKVDSFKYLGVNLSTNLSWSCGLYHHENQKAGRFALLSILWLPGPTHNGETVYYNHPSTSRTRLHCLESLPPERHPNSWKRAKICFQSLYWPVVNWLWNTAKLSKYTITGNKEMQPETEFTL